MPPSWSACPRRSCSPSSAYPVGERRADSRPAARTGGRSGAAARRADANDASHAAPSLGWRLPPGAHRESCGPCSGRAAARPRCEPAGDHRPRGQPEPDLADRAFRDRRAAAVARTLRHRGESTVTTTGPSGAQRIAASALGVNRRTRRHPTRQSSSAAFRSAAACWPPSSAYGSGQTCHRPSRTPRSTRPPRPGRRCPSSAVRARQRQSGDRMQELFGAVADIRRQDLCLAVLVGHLAERPAVMAQRPRGRERTHGTPRWCLHRACAAVASRAGRVGQVVGRRVRTVDWTRWAAVFRWGMAPQRSVRLWSM